MKWHIEPRRIIFRSASFIKRPIILQQKDKNFKRKQNNGGI